MLARSRRDKRRMNARGYLGPIGDDIPSLIPILVGLLTFFAAFTFTLNEFNQRSASFSADRDTLVIANALKGDSYLSTSSEFETACNGLRVRGLNYASAVVESSQWNQLAQDAQAHVDAGGIGGTLAQIANHVFYFTDPATGDAHPLSCARGIDSPLDSDDLDEILSSHQYVVLAFPVALEISTAVVPATLVVITWRV